MAYREAQGAREARRLSLELELQDLDDRTREVPYLALKRGELQRELTELSAFDAPVSRAKHHWRRAVAALAVVTLVAWAAFRIGTYRPLDAVEPIEIVHGEFPRVDPPPPREDDFDLAAPISTSAAAISLDFVGSGVSLASSEVAGFVPLTNWNDLYAGGGSNRHLIDAVGSPLSGTHVTWSSGVVWATLPQKADGDSRMLSGYIVQNHEPGTPGTLTVSVSSLPTGLVANGYAVIVYSDEIGNPDDQVTCMKLTARDQEQTFCLRDAKDRDFPLREAPTGYVVAAGTADVGLDTPKANCAIFKDLSLDAFSLEVTSGASTSSNYRGFLRSPINGLQIVPMGSLFVRR